MIKRLIALLVLLIGISSGAIPDGYYNHHERVLLTPEKIISFLDEINYSSQYREDVFDCTKIASHCEYRLENIGVETEFALSWTELHMFIRCNTTEGWLPFDACTTSGHAYAIRDKNNYHYNTTNFADIYEVLRRFPNDEDKLDWWNTTITWRNQDDNQDQEESVR